MQDCSVYPLTQRLALWLKRSVSHQSIVYLEVMLLRLCMFTLILISVTAHGQVNRNGQYTVEVTAGPIFLGLGRNASESMHPRNSPTNSSRSFENGFKYSAAFSYKLAPDFGLYMRMDHQEMTDAFAYQSAYSNSGWYSWSNSGEGRIKTSSWLLEAGFIFRFLQTERFQLEFGSGVRATLAADQAYEGTASIKTISTHYEDINGSTQTVTTETITELEYDPEEVTGVSDGVIQKTCGLTARLRVLGPLWLGAGVQAHLQPPVFGNLSLHPQSDDPIYVPTTNMLSANLALAVQFGTVKARKKKGS